MGRIEKVNEQIRREIGRIIMEELADPRLEFVSITGADVSKDLRNARIHFSVLGDSAQIEAAAGSLARARGTIRRELGRRIKMRFVPDLNFIYDDSIQTSSHLDSVFKEIKDETQSDPENHPEP